MLSFVAKEHSAKLKGSGKGQGNVVDVGFLQLKIADVRSFYLRLNKCLFYSHVATLALRYEWILMYHVVRT